MATFILHRRKFFATNWQRLTLLAAGFTMVSLTPVLGAGYVISAKDRAQATLLSQQAYTTFQAGDYAQALGLLVQSDQLRPDQPDGWNLRGVIFLKQKAYDKAEAAFARATALDPNLWAAQFNLAEVFFQRRDFARARARFESLLAHTDRFKEANKWELVQYKVFIASVLMGDNQAAEKKLAKLPAKGGATPAYLYAQAALAFGHKNPAQAQKSILAAQSAFPGAINDLFSDSLVQVGWQTPPPLPTLASNVPAYPPGAAPNQSAPLPGASGRGEYDGDAQLQAASAGPLPVADAPTRPVVTPITPALRNAAGAEPKPRARPAPTVAVELPAAPRSATGTDLENGGLLLDQ